MRKRGAFASPEALKSNPPLKELVLGYNQITDKGACELAEARCASAREEGRAPHSPHRTRRLYPYPPTPSPLGHSLCVCLCLPYTPPLYKNTVSRREYLGTVLISSLRGAKNKNTSFDRVSRLLFLFRAPVFIRRLQR